MASALTFLKNCAEWLLHSQHIVAFSCATITWPASVAAGGQFPTALFLFVYSGTFIIYNLDRLPQFAPEDGINHPQRQRWLKKNRWPLIIQICLATITIIALMKYLPKTIFLGALLPGIAALFYSFPLVPIKGKKIRLKSLNGFKEICICCSWLIVTCFFPLLLKDTTSTAEWLTFTCLTAINFFCCVLQFEMRDIEGDRRNGIRSLALMLNWDKCRTIILWASALNTLIALSAAAFFNNAPFLIASGATAICLFLLCGRKAPFSLYDGLRDLSLTLPYWSCMFLL